MRSLEAYVLYSIRLAILLCSIAVPVSAQTSLPTIIQETETAGSYTYSGTWSWNGQGDSATWNNRAAATLTVKTFAPSSVEIIRTDLSNTTSEGLTATYTGQISAEGNSIVNRKVTWTWPGHAGYPITGTWTGEWTTAGTQPGALKQSVASIPAISSTASTQSPSATPLPPATNAAASTQNFTDRAAFQAVLGGQGRTVGFAGVLKEGETFSGFVNPLVLQGMTFFTPTQGTFVDTTTANYYAQGNTQWKYPSDFIVNSKNDSRNNELDISLSCPTTAIGLDFGGIGFNGPGSATITLSNGHTYSQTNLPTIGQTTFVGFVSTQPITSLTLNTVNDSWAVLDVVVADCNQPQLKVANITTTPRSVSGTEVMKNSCVAQTYTSTPRLRSTPLLVAEEYMTSNGFRLVVDQNGNWTAPTVTFPAGSTIPNLASLGGVYTPESTYNMTVSSGGTLTVTEKSSANFSFDPPAGAFRQLTGSATWSATQTVDLKSGKDTLTFTASLDAKYLGGSQQEPGKASNCTINSQYSGENDAIDAITLVVLPSPTCPATYLSVAAGNVYVPRPEKFAEVPKVDLWNLFWAVFRRSPEGVFIAGVFAPSEIADDELEDALTRCPPITQTKDNTSRCRNADHPDLFRGGNAQGPRLDNVRPNDIIWAGPGLLSTQSGISSSGSIKGEGPWWKFPSTVIAPSGICLVNNYQDHWLWEPATEMPLATYIDILETTKPNWSRAQ